RAKRETDVFARLGGEEFCLVLPGTDVPGAKVFADRLRRSFEALEIDTGRSFVSCTMSIGVAYACASALAEGRADIV
ncbi:diguanylate cyclase, partial [Escherichia coli]|nr:diguanylate cyclase [Escherichia coli]